MGIYRNSKWLDTNLKYLLQYPIKSVDSKSDHYRTTVEFRNGMKFEFWSVNYPYAWMSRGELTSSKGKILWNYDELCPSKGIREEWRTILTNKLTSGLLY